MASGRSVRCIADLLFNFFGRPAYLFTVMVFYLGWMLYREQKTQIELTAARLRPAFRRFRRHARDELRTVDTAFLTGWF